ncbi:hypothetical protein M9H77_13502 [Catharanthus roseus]|uniref:Uncharacterized protein n=1 Tax=Catharanthus roseus TaxID=4058 RepID=A0ACC0BKL0_CATRO|nr:hypothetical protein M9H77_13502 [Catharanthus roseus]
MDTIHPVRVLLFWDSEIARDAYGPYFTGVVQKSWTLTTSRMISHAELEEELQTPVIPVTENTMTQWESSQWYNSARYDYTQYGAFLVRYFHQHREETQNCVHPFSTRIFDKFLRIEIKSREHKITIYNLREAIYMVRSPIQVSGTGNNVYTLRMNNKSCSCGKWKTYTLPCSHALTICRKNSTRADTYMLDIYSRQMYRRTYQTNFHPVLSKNFWRDVPYNLTFYPPNMNKERGRKQGTRFQGKWIIEIRILHQGVANVACRNIIEKFVITPIQTIYKFVFLKVL